MGQRMGSEGIIVGPIYKFIWKKKSFEKGPKMAFPKETKIFGLARADIRGKGKPDMIVFDQSDRLNIISEDGKSVWRSGARYGVTSNYYDTKKKKVDGYRPESSPLWRVYISPRILVRDLDGDGINEIIVSKHDSSWGMFDRSRAFDSGEVNCLIWEENGLVPQWKTKEISGYISDYQLKDADNDGEEELVVAVVASRTDSSVMGAKGTSNIHFFKIF
jgi:hypothetical protein